MLWSLIKILFFVALVAALSVGANLLMETGPGVRLVVGTLEFNLGPLQAVVAALVLLAVIWAVFKLAGLLVAFLRFLNGDETAVSRYFNRNRERKGYQALADALIALSSGEGRQAMTKAARAEKLLNKPEVTALVTAQACEMVGDRRRAESAYRTLLKNDKTRFVGIRGILSQKLEDGDTDTALALAQKAFALRPRNAGMQDTLLKLQADKHDWKGARQTLGAKLKHGQMPRDLHRRRDAVLAVSQAREVLSEGNSIEAREAAIEAARLSPDLVPAAVMAARAYIEQDKSRYAARVVKKAWEAQPHPELATAFAEIEPKEAPKERLKRFEQLLRLKPDHPESKMLRAELLIAAEDFPAARRAMGDLASEDPTTRTLAIMAAIERGEGADEAVVRGWLARAVTAPRGPQWVCENCQAIAAEWGPTCANCGAFDTLDWRRPTVPESAGSPTGSEMLPLIVGTPATGAESRADGVDVVDMSGARPAEDGPADQSRNEAEAARA
jgi:HemY protein